MTLDIGTHTIQASDRFSRIDKHYRDFLPWNWEICQHPVHLAEYESTISHDMSHDTADPVYTGRKGPLKNLVSFFFFGKRCSQIPCENEMTFNWIAALIVVYVIIHWLHEYVFGEHLWLFAIQYMHTGSYYGSVLYMHAHTCGYELAPPPFPWRHMQALLNAASPWEDAGLDPTRCSEESSLGIHTITSSWVSPSILGQCVVWCALALPTGCWASGDDVSM